MAVATLVSVVLVLPTPYDSVTAAAVPANSYMSVVPSDTHGDVLFLVVRTESENVFGVLRAWLDGDAALERSPQRVGSVAPRDLQQSMWDSVVTAIAVATERLGLDPTAFDAHIAIGELGGPSAGLAFAIAATDLLSPGDLTAGRVVAATGELTPTGEVLPVGRVAEKAMAAARAGVDLLLVPAADRDEARRAAPGLRIVGVATFDEALTALAGV